ncbi:hypothetical protein FQN57_002580, partial [Myotisia sp. PD_48]
SYLTRHLWLSRLPVPDYFYTRLPTNFRGDAEAGLSSADFNLASNIEAGDSRAGLDQRGKSDVLKIMKNKKVDFNEARRIYTEQRFAKNNIGPDGRPRDPKFGLEEVHTPVDFASESVGHWLRLNLA